MQTNSCAGELVNGEEQCVHFSFLSELNYLDGCTFIQNDNQTIYHMLYVMLKPFILLVHIANRYRHSSMTLQT